MKTKTENKTKVVSVWPRGQFKPGTFIRYTKQGVVGSPVTRFAYVTHKKPAMLQ